MIQLRTMKMNLKLHQTTTIIIIITVTITIIVILQRLIIIIKLSCFRRRVTASRTIRMASSQSRYRRRLMTLDRDADDDDVTHGCATALRRAATNRRHRNQHAPVAVRVSQTRSWHVDVASSRACCSLRSSTVSSSASSYRFSSTFVASHCLRLVVHCK